MKLLFICQGLPKLSDGSLLVAYRLAEFLSKGHELELVFLKSSNDTASPPPFFRDVIAVPFKPRQDKFSRLKNVFSLKPNLVSLYASREMGKEIYRLSRERRYDIIIALTMNTAQFASHLEGVKKIVIPHDAEHLIYRQILDEAKGVLDRTKAWLWWKKVCSYQKRVYPLFDRCVVDAEIGRIALQSLSDRIKAEVLSIGVDTDFLRPAEERPKKDILVFVGVMNTWSNVDAVTYFAKKIFPIIEKEIPSIKFSIVGKRPAASVKKLASQNIIVTGEVPDIRPYLEQALMLVAPFRIGTGLKHKLLEAMAMGVPVVSTKLGTNGIDVKDGEDIILAETAEEFARACINIFNNSQLREKIVRNALVLIREKHSWERIGQTFENMLKEVLKN